MPPRRRPPEIQPTDAAARLARIASEQLHFSLDTGHIRLFDQRMLLMHGASIAELRRELIESLGLDKAREMLTRVGYHQGAADAEHARSVMGDVESALPLGPPIRELEGFVRNEARSPMHFDFVTGEFFGDYDWTSSWEADAHLQQVGISGVPACWMMIGYATGYCSALIGRPVLWREHACVAMGAPRCRVEGRSLERWADVGVDVTDDLRFLQIERFVSAPRDRVRPRPLPASGGKSVFRDLIGASAPFNAVVHRMRRAGDTDVTVLFLGESGVGKELFSRTLHAIGPRKGGPFVAVNCAAIPRDLVEAELFGVEKGAFTGAIRSRPGKFERADGGTLFLDEVSSLPLAAQGQLLRALQEGEIERVGDTRTRHVDVRIVAAANRDLRAEVAAGRFRDDLFFRLNVFPIEIPPLRERRADIPLLANLFLERSSRRFAKTVGGFTAGGSQALWSHDWPGNVRELENAIERAVVLVERDAPIDVHHLFIGDEGRGSAALNLSQRGDLEEPEVPAPDDADAADRLAAQLFDAVPDFGVLEDRWLEHALRRSGGNVSAAARLLKLRRGQVEYRLKKRARARVAR